MVKCIDCKHWRRRFASVGSCSIVLPRWVEEHLQRDPGIGINRESFSDDGCDLGQREISIPSIDMEDL